MGLLGYIYMNPSNHINLQLHIIRVFMYELNKWYLKDKLKSNACEVLGEGGRAFAWGMWEELGL